MKIPIWKRPFLYLSGTDFKTISESPSDNATRYSILGVLVCIPAILGFCSASFAVSLVFPDSSYTVYIAIVWAFTILTIDRSIAAHNPEVYDDDTENQAQLKSQKTKARNIYISRLVLSIVLGFVIAEPLCVRLFSDEIKDEIKDEIRIKVLVQTKYLDSLINNENNIINTHYLRWQALGDSAQDEATGHGGSGQRGTDQIYNSIKERADRQEDIYNESKSSGKKIIDSLIIKKAKLELDINKNKANGLSGQINALNKVAVVNPALFYSVWVMRLFFVFLELIPLILKGALKKSTDAYVVMCHQNNKIAITYNENEENNSTKKRMVAATLEEDEVLDQILKTKNIERAAKDFKFFFGMNEQSAKDYEDTKSNIEKIIGDESLRLEVLNNLLTAYQDFLSKTINYYTSNDSTNEDNEEN